MHFNRKTHDLETKLELLIQKVEKLETQVTCLTKENHSLKTQIGTLQSKVNEVVKKRPSVSSSTQCDPTIVHNQHVQCTLFERPQEDRDAQSTSTTLNTPKRATAPSLIQNESKPATPVTIKETVHANSKSQASPIPIDNPFEALAYTIFFCRGL